MTVSQQNDLHVVCEHGKLLDGPSAKWNYFEVGRGKGPCDGIGGTNKRLAGDAVKRNITNIQEAHDYTHGLAKKGRRALDHRSSISLFTSLNAKKAVI